MPTSGVINFTLCYLLLHIKTAWSITPKRPEVRNHLYLMVQNIHLSLFSCLLACYSSEVDIKGLRHPQQVLARPAKITISIQNKK